MEFRTLKSDEITLRVGTVGDGFYTLLLYKDARCDMNILDETVGAENWQRDHKEVKGNLYCGVGIWNENKKQWIWKWDCGTESNTEKEKGEASDSFKRACVNWGIGRELYTSPKIYVDCETYSEDNGKHWKIKNFADIKRSNNMRVKEIEYNSNREITRLIIVDNKGVQVFPKNNIPQEQPKEIKEKEEIVGGNYVWKGGKHKEKKLCETPSDYLDWYLSNGYDNFIKENIKKYRKDLYLMEHPESGEVIV